jgi:hypothetical protein
MLFQNENSRTGHYIRCIVGAEPIINIDTSPRKTQEELDKEIMNNSLYFKQKKKKM